MLRRTLVAAGCVAGLALGALAGLPAAPARADAPCPDAKPTLLAFNASRAWSKAETRGLGVTVGVVGAPDRVAEAVCAARALAPEATVRAGASGAIVVVADTSVDPASVGSGALVVAAAGDAGGPMTQRPQGIVNVAAVDVDTGVVLSSSARGPAMTMAAYGKDTSTAAGYAAGLAALLRAQHQDWPARQVVAQMAGSINPYSATPPDDSEGFGLIQPAQAVSLDPIVPSTLAGFDARFPANVPPRTGAPASSAPTSPSSASSPGASGSATDPGAPSSTPTPSASDGAATASSSATATPSSAPVADTTDTAQQWPTNPLATGGPSNGAQAGAAKGGGGGGVSPVLFIGLLLLVGGGGYLAWQRRQQQRAAPAKPPSEWEAPSGPRHSGYSPPDE